MQVYDRYFTSNNRQTAPPSPYYNESHRKLRKYMRDFVDKEIMSFCHEWDEAKAIPPELFIKTAKAGIQVAVVGNVNPQYLPYGLPAGIDPSEWDIFHDVIVTDELSRCGSGGVILCTCSQNRVDILINSHHLKRFYGVFVVVLELVCLQSSILALNILKIKSYGIV